ncbi:PQQ-dependent sugar dehydrogenase, partial [Candidatus Microgenomates bacterium]|nr:PQQ-dependent sugar dehydrogenase [Candidatus Microgenomates bacterium]
KMSIYAYTSAGARDLELDPQGNLLVSLTDKGRVVKLPENITVVDHLNKPHGIAFYNGRLYVAETNGVSYFDYNNQTFKATNKVKIIDLPSGAGHFTRSLLFRGTKLYISIGSSCNVCVESDSKRASVWEVNPDGTDAKPYAIGLRNSVFMALNPKTQDIWATEMGRDLLGDDVPPEEINILKPANYFGNQPYHYGWPYCYADKVPDSETNPDNSKFNCGSTINPHISFQAHSAPLGLSFFEDDLLVSFHGSWNRPAPTGYKVVRFKLDKDGNKVGQEDFISGWLKNGKVLGRPVDVLVKDNKQIYISDDKANVVYLLEKQ